MSIPNYVAIIKPLAEPKVPNNMQIDLRLLSDMQKVINKFTFSDWNNFILRINPDFKRVIKNILAKKEALENFFGIDLVEPCGMNWPGVIIPILVVLVTFLSSYLMMRTTSQIHVDDVSAGQQKMFLFVMPLLMGFLTLNLSSGVGVYWITSSVMQSLQQFFFMSKYNEKLRGAK